MFKKREKGFTLIELMVVIAIIAILATVVLVSLQAARERAEDSNRTAAVTQLRSLAETYFARDLDYGVLTDAPSGPDELAILYTEYGHDPSETGHVLHLRVSTDKDEYCAEIALKEGEGTTDAAFFCVDDSLRAVKHTDGRKCLETSISCE